MAENTANEEDFEQEDYFAVSSIDEGRGRQVKKTSRDLIWKMENFWRH